MAAQGVDDRAELLRHQQAAELGRGRQPDAGRAGQRLELGQAAAVGSVRDGQHAVPRREARTARLHHLADALVPGVPGRHRRRRRLEEHARAGRSRRWTRRRSGPGSRRPRPAAPARPRTPPVPCRPSAQPSSMALPFRSACGGPDCQGYQTRRRRTRSAWFVTGDLADVPGSPGEDDPCDRFLPRRYRVLAPSVRAVLHRARNSARAPGGDHRTSHWGVGGPAGPQPADAPRGTR